jgi:hypothetical protein
VRNKFLPHAQHPLKNFTFANFSTIQIPIFFLKSFKSKNELFTNIFGRKATSDNFNFGLAVPKFFLLYAHCTRQFVENHQNQGRNDKKIAFLEDN